MRSQFGVNLISSCCHRFLHQFLPVFRIQYSTFQYGRCSLLIFFCIFLSNSLNSLIIDRRQPKCLFAFAIHLCVSENQEPRLESCEGFPFDWVVLSDLEFLPCGFLLITFTLQSSGIESPRMVALLTLCHNSNPLICAHHKSNHYTAL